MNATRNLHMCAMPDEILLEISQWITSEKDALNWMSTGSRIYGIGQERLLRLNASRSGSGLRSAIIKGNLPLFEIMLERGRYHVDMVFDKRILRSWTETMVRWEIFDNAATPLLAAIAHGPLEKKYGGGVARRQDKWFEGQPYCKAGGYWSPILWALSAIDSENKHSDTDIILNFLLDHGVDTQVEVETEKYSKADVTSYTPLILAVSSPYVSSLNLRRVFDKYIPGLPPQKLEEQYNACLREFFESRWATPISGQLRSIDRESMAKLDFILEKCAQGSSSAIVNSLRRIVGLFHPNRVLIKVVRIHLQYLRQQGPTGNILNALDSNGFSILATIAKALFNRQFEDLATQRWSLRMIRDRHEDLFRILLDSGASPVGGELDPALMDALPPGATHDPRLVNPIDILRNNAKIRMGGQRFEYTSDQMPLCEYLANFLLSYKSKA
ncbi:hypothetical protein F5Y03DRAFT_400948 [Xylaria venustula]|nr:hypothetical protein F5Y03DRAFT_400948 [Xylaria venustula]